MKTVDLKVGIKGKDPVKVPCPVAESVDDMLKLAKGNENVVVRCFNRGFRIEAQEKSGARDTARELLEAGKSGDEVRNAVASKVANFDPTVSVPRTGQPRKPKDVKIDPNKKAYTPEEFRALLASHGVKVNFKDEAGNPIGEQTPAPAAAAAPAGKGK